MGDRAGITGRRIFPGRDFAGEVIGERFLHRCHCKFDILVGHLCIQNGGTIAGLYKNSLYALNSSKLMAAMFRQDTRVLGNFRRRRPNVFRGMRDEPYWMEAFKDPADEVDTDRIEALIVAKAREIVEETPNLGAILLECSLMPPYASAVQNAIGLPVYDFKTMIDFVQRTTHRHAYQGYY